jgi:hypothetical protein
MIGSISLKSSKRTRLGSYICKVGYFDIRQKVAPVGKNISSDVLSVIVCHNGHRIAGPFKSHDAARIHAAELMSEGVRYVKHRKG